MLTQTRSQPRIDQARQWRGVVRLAQACEYEVEHAQQVTRLSMWLFDGLRRLHHLDTDARFYMQCGALLHDIGVIEGRRGHHKTSLRYILESDQLTLEPDQRLIVGSIARYHRAALPSADHAHYAALSPAQRHLANVLAGIVRLADVLDRSHGSLVQRLSTSFCQERIVVLCHTSRPLDLPAERAADKARLLEQTFGRRVAIRFTREEDR